MKQHIGLLIMAILASLLATTIAYFLLVPKRKRMFYESYNIEYSSIQMNINWNYIYKFSIIRLLNNIHSMINSYSACFFKIGDTLLPEGSMISMSRVSEALKKYRNDELTKYVKDQDEIVKLSKLIREQKIYEIAQVIQEEENVAQSVAIKKVIWLIYSKNKIGYRLKYLRLICSYNRQGVLFEGIRQYL